VAMEDARLGPDALASGPSSPEIPAYLPGLGLRQPVWDGLAWAVDLGCACPDKQPRAAAGCAAAGAWQGPTCRTDARLL
jgi:hypothetical protein